MNKSLLFSIFSTINIRLLSCTENISQFQEKYYHKNYLRLLFILIKSYFNLLSLNSNLKILTEIKSKLNKFFYQTYFSKIPWYFSIFFLE